MLKIALVFSLWVSSLVFASAEFVPLQERAEGQSLTGASTKNDSLYSNPAGSAFQTLYSLDGTYVLNKGFAVSVLDTRTSSVGGALGYYRMSVEEGSNELTQGGKVSLFGKYNEYLAVGVSGKMIWSPSLMRAVDEQNHVYEKIKKGEGRNSQSLTDVDVGTLTNLGFVQIGATLKNAFGGNEFLDTRREMALGGRINWNQLLFFSMTMTSKVYNVKPYRYGVGAEFITPYYVSIKGGYHYQTELSQSTWSVGASFVSPKFDLHYALELPQYTDGITEHLIGLTVYL